ncbi:MAG: hypothetical protein IKZ34_02630 [Alphaproteobacteria bacterium]|nr:hypothetical protein [Alphaproteobacteria bacterium]
MNIALYNKRKNAILSVCPDATNIIAPAIKGAQNSMLTAKTADGEVMFKFNDYELAQKNVAVSKLYNMRGIPAPQISLHTVGDIHFEMYKKFPQKTLFEAIQDGMPPEYIKQIYREVLFYFEKMANISPAYINSNLKNTAHEVAKVNVSNVNNKAIGTLCAAIVYLANISKQSDMALFHSDITPKNIIVSNDGHLVSFIDMDNVCVCSKKHAFSMMAAKYHELGFDVEELMSEYYKVSLEHLPAESIKRRVSIANLSKKLLWKHSVSKSK